MSCWLLTMGLQFQPMEERGRAMLSFCVECHGVEWKGMEHMSLEEFAEVRL
jgi:cytochrome c553